MSRNIPISPFALCNWLWVNLKIDSFWDFSLCPVQSRKWSYNVNLTYLLYYLYLLWIGHAHTMDTPNVALKKREPPGLLHFTSVVKLVLLVCMVIYSSRSNEMPGKPSSPCTVSCSSLSLMPKISSVLPWCLSLKPLASVIFLPCVNNTRGKKA